MTFSRLPADSINTTPYRQTVDLEILFSGNSQYTEGSGIVVGNNDILTASHAVYKEGKTIESIRIYAGRSDVNGSDSYLYYYTGEAQFTHNSVGNSDGTIDISDIGNDYAIIGIAEPIGDIIGYSTMSSTAYVGTTTSIAGYGTNVSVDVLAADLNGVTTDINRTTNIIRYNIEASPGNSGGPIFQTIENETVVVGVVSASGGYGAFLDTDTISSLSTIMGNNNAIISSNQISSSQTTTLSGSSLHDIITGDSNNDTIIASLGNDIIVGNDGIDTVVYSDYAVSKASVIIEDDSTLVTINNTTDNLSGIERVQFSDGTLVIDVINDIAATVYRLYRASFSRTPDSDGLSVNVAAIEESGLSTKELASAFLVSGEFQATYGSNLSTSDYITLLYSNVLSRSPDSDGFNAWSSNINSGAIDRADALVGFSDSQENISIVATDISSQGIWLI